MRQPPVRPSARVALVAVGALAFAVPSVASAIGRDALEPSGSHGNERLFVPDRIIVRYEPGTRSARRAGVRAKAGGKVARRLSIARAEVIDIPDAMSVREAVAAYSANRAVAYAEPDFYAEALMVPDDPFFGQQWSLDNTGQGITFPFDPASYSGTADADIDAREAWDAMGVPGGDASDVVVAVADSGIAIDSPDLAPNLWTNDGEIGGNGLDDDGNGFVDDVHGFDFQNTSMCDGAACLDSDPRDQRFDSHGSAAAGVIGARGNDGYGVTGIAQRVQLMALKVFPSNLRESPQSAFASAFDYAGDNGADIVNASLGAECPSQLMTDAIASHPDVLYVAAAGNGGSDGVGDNNDLLDAPADEASAAECMTGPGTADYPGPYPCNLNDGPEAAGEAAIDLPNVICVAASGQSDDRPGFSNFGATAVDIAAPGSLILAPQAAYRAHYRSNFEDGTFTGQWVDGGLEPIPQGGPGPDGGWRQVGSALEGDFSFSETAIGTNYPANAQIDAQMASAQRIPSGTGGCKISHLLDMRGEPDFDFLHIFVSLNGGAYPTTPTRSHTITHGVSAREIDVSHPAFQGATIQLALRFTSDNEFQNEGVRFDDLGLRCLGGDYQPAKVGLEGFGTHQLVFGTSFATPHVAGIAALLKQADPSLAGGSLKEAILAGGDPNAAFAVSGSTPVATGDRANAADALRRPQFTFAPASPAKTDSVNVTGPPAPNASDYATVQVFTNGGCTGVPGATGTPATFSGAGFGVAVSQGATTQLTVRYVDPDGNAAICSHPQSFTENSIAPDGGENPSPGGNTAPPGGNTSPPGGNTSPPGTGVPTPNPLARSAATLISSKLAGNGKSLALKIACPSGSLDCLNGVATLKTQKKLAKRQSKRSRAKKKRLLLGSATFSIASGQTVTVRLKLNSTARKLLSRGPVKARLTLTVPDGASPRLTSAKSLTMKSRR